MCYARESMASKPPIKSSLNPNAPVYVPAAFLAADDFSPEWWTLIQTNDAFKEWWMKERYEPEEDEQAAPVAGRREDNDLEDINELLLLGFQPGILDDIGIPDNTEDLPAPPSPVAVPQQQHHLPYQQRQPYYQQQPQLHQVQRPQLHQAQQPRQHEQGQDLQNEYVNLLRPPSHSFQKFRSVDGAGGAQFYRGTVLNEGRPQ